jgi:hypothetical protein
MGGHETMADPNLLDNIKLSLTSQLGTWFVGLLIATLTLFSSRITESIKFALNRADSRTRQYEELAAEVSQYIFSAELAVEFIENDWTTKQSLTELLKDYNQSIMTLRKKEFVYLAWIRKFWNENQAIQYENFMKSVRVFDSTIHSLNDEFEAVNITGSKQKVDKKMGEEALKIIKPAVESLSKNGKSLLMSLL